jgi:hypothetical protein
MLHIRRQNNSIQYAFEPYTHQKVNTTYDLVPLVPHPSIHMDHKCVRMDKWYIANNVMINSIVDAYITKFQEFVSTHQKYMVHMDVHEFRNHLIKKLYYASESRKKSFV